MAGGGEPKSMTLTPLKPLPEEDLYRCIASLNQMASFYETKRKLAPEKQAIMFKGFVESIEFALQVIMLYRESIKEVEK
jgi:hypothetical protein